MKIKIAKSKESLIKYLLWFRYAFVNMSVMNWTILLLGAFIDEIMSLKHNVGL